MSDNLEKITDELKKSGFMQKEDFSKMFEATNELTIGNVIKHEDCGDSNCQVCGMKSAIDGSAYERGIRSGIAFGQKYPEVHIVQE